MCLPYAARSNQEQPGLIQWILFYKFRACYFGGREVPLRAFNPITRKVAVLVARGDMRLRQQTFRTRACCAFTPDYAALLTEYNLFPARICTDSTKWSLSLLAGLRYILPNNMPSRFPIACGLSRDEAHILVLWHFLS